MLRKLLYSPRGSFIVCVTVTNILSAIVTMFVWVPLSWHIFPEGHFLTPYIPLILSVLAAIPISSAVSRRSAKPIQDMLEATKSISGGDYSVRVEESGEGDMAELLRSFNRMTAELGGTEMMRSDFINTFSHEFKTPIVSIRGFAKRLRSGNLTPQQREEYLTFIVEESERLSNLSASVLLLARYENQNLVTGQTVYDLDEQIRTCVLRLEGQWEPRNISFDLDMPRLTCRNNMEMMEHVWLNLIGNAVKFSHDGGSIRISGRKEEAYLAVRVQDRGIGIHPEHLEHIFDKFYQEDSAHAAAGNGLGLALVRRIVELSGGRIRVDSEKNVGTTVCVWLPCGL